MRETTNVHRFVQGATINSIDNERHKIIHCISAVGSSIIDTNRTTMVALYF